MAQVRIYTTSYCPYCRAAKALLRRKAVQFEEIDVTSPSTQLLGRVGQAASTWNIGTLSVLADWAWPAATTAQATVSASAM